MIYYLLLPLLSVLLVVIQTTIADIIFSGRLVIEISLIVVVYIGFRLDLIRGSIFSFVLGFVLDCIAGSVMGLFTLIYVVIFLCSFVTSFLADTTKMYFMALFCFSCAVLEETMVTLFYKFILKFDVFASVFYVFLPQALVVGLLAPVFFYLMYQVEVFFYGKPFQRPEHDGSTHISAKI